MRTGLWRIRFLMVILVVSIIGCSSCAGRSVQEAQSPPAAPVTPEAPANPQGNAQPTFVFVDQGVTVETFETQCTFSASGGSPISPDGKYILGTLRGAGSVSVVAYPLRPGTSPVEVYSRPTALTGGSSLILLGWTSDTDCVFAIDNTEQPGDIQGRLGVSVLRGSVSDGSSRAVSFIPDASCRQGAFYPEDTRGEWLLPMQSKVYLHLRTVENVGGNHVQVFRAFWEVNLRSGQARLLRGKIPAYDGLFRATMTSDGRYFVYELHEPDRRGIYVLDTATCEERALLPEGATKSFLPAVSPDGRFLAAYVAQQTKDGLGQATGYDDYQGVDGVLPAAHALRIVDMSGREVAAVDMKDRVISDLQWSADSRSLSFQVGTMAKLGSHEYAFAPESIWMVQWAVAGTETPLAPFQVTTVSDESGTVRSVEQHPTADGVGVIWSVAQGDVRLSVPGASTIVIKQLALTHVGDGWWRIPPASLGGFAVDWLGEDSRSEPNELWLLGSEFSRKVVSYAGAGQFEAYIVGVTGNRVLVYRRPDPAQQAAFLDVFMFAPEYLSQKAWLAKPPWDRARLALDQVLRAEGIVHDFATVANAEDSIMVDMSFYLFRFPAEGCYLWADRYGNWARIAISPALRPTFQGGSLGQVRFICSAKGGTPVFPYVLVASPYTSELREETWFKEPREDRYSIGVPGSAYRVDDVAVSQNRIDLTLSVTGSKPEASGKGGDNALPATSIVEHSPRLSLTLQDVALPAQMKERLKEFTSPYATLESVAGSGGNLEVVFSVAGTYSFSTQDRVSSDGHPSHVTCTILFDKPLPRDPRPQYPVNKGVK